MTAFEATIELVKASMSSSNGCTYIFENETNRKDFLKGIEETYTKLSELKNKDKQIS